MRSFTSVVIRHVILKVCTIGLSLVYLRTFQEVAVRVEDFVLPFVIVYIVYSLAIFFLLRRHFQKVWWGLWQCRTIEVASTCQVTLLIMALFACYPDQLTVLPLFFSFCMLLLIREHAKFSTVLVRRRTFHMQMTSRKPNVPAKNLEWYLKDAQSILEGDLQETPKRVHLQRLRHQLSIVWEKIFAPELYEKEYRLVMQKIEENLTP